MEAVAGWVENWRRKPEQGNEISGHGWKVLMPDSTEQFRALLQRGLVIPAHPLALTEDLKLDEKTQRALTRYYCDAGSGGVAVGVHTTQFSIRDSKVRTF